MRMRKASEQTVLNYHYDITKLSLNDPFSQICSPSSHNYSYSYTEQLQKKNVLKNISNGILSSIVQKQSI